MLRGSVMRIYEVGIRNSKGEYYKLIDYEDRISAEAHAKSIKQSLIESDFEIMIMDKSYSLVSTTPHIVN
jgi:hypothetical protein